VSSPELAPQRDPAPLPAPQPQALSAQHPIHLPRLSVLSSLGRAKHPPDRVSLPHSPNCNSRRSHHPAQHPTLKKPHNKGKLMATRSKQPRHLILHSHNSISSGLCAIRSRVKSLPLPFQVHEIARILFSPVPPTALASSSATPRSDDAVIDAPRACARCFCTSLQPRPHSRHLPHRFHHCSS
jgi:hypothetical protein